MEKLHMKYFAAILVLIAFGAKGQVYSNKPTLKVDAQAKDSLAQRDYPYALPILGKKAARLGFDLPYSAGLGVNYIWQQSDLVIENLQVGFNHNPPKDLSEVIRFDKATSELSGMNFRPDVWLFPFLNVYGIFAKGNPSTAVDFGVFVPDQDGNYTRVLSMNTKANFEATTFGFGLTPTVGVKGMWFALDMNFTWNDIPQLSDPAFAYVFGPRLGKSFKLKKPERSVAFWVGGFRLKLNTGTSGSIDLTDLVDTSGLQARVDNGIVLVDTKQAQVDAWWNSLSPPQQNNPVNKAKHETANRALERAGTFLGDIDNALNDEQHASVQYSLDKRPKDMWNFLIGSQFQINKSWMLRAEYGFLGTRDQLIAGLQYRFPL